MVKSVAAANTRKRTPLIALTVRSLTCCPAMAPPMTAIAVAAAWPAVAPMATPSGFCAAPAFASGGGGGRIGRGFRLRSQSRQRKQQVAACRLVPLSTPFQHPLHPLHHTPSPFVPPPPPLTERDRREHRAVAPLGEEDEARDLEQARPRGGAARADLAAALRLGDGRLRVLQLLLGAAAAAVAAGRVRRAQRLDAEDDEQRDARDLADGQARHQGVGDAREDDADRDADDGHRGERRERAGKRDEAVLWRGVWRCGVARERDGFREEVVAVWRALL